MQDSGSGCRLRPEAKVEANGGWHSVMISGVDEQRQETLGQRLDELAEAAQESPYEFACDLLVDSESRVSIVGYAMSDENTERVLVLQAPVLHGLVRWRGRRSATRAGWPSPFLWRLSASDSPLCVGAQKH